MTRQITKSTRTYDDDGKLVSEVVEAVTEDLPDLRALRSLPCRVEFRRAS